MSLFLLTSLLKVSADPTRLTFNVSNNKNSAEISGPGDIDQQQE
jgi:hypothetical protein